HHRIEEIADRERVKERHLDRPAGCAPIDTKIDSLVQCAPGRLATTGREPGRTGVCGRFEHRQRARNVDARSRLPNFLTPSASVTTQSHTQQNEYVALLQLFALPVAPYTRLNVCIGPLSRGANGVRLNASLTLCYRHRGGKQAVILS